MRPSANNPLAGAVLLIFVAGLFGAFPPPARSAREKTVTAVAVAGNRRLAASSILARVKTRAGEPYSQETVNADLKRLSEWGPFSSVRFDVEEETPGAVEVTIVVEERPLVNKVYYEGNREFDADDLAEETATAPGKILDQAVLKKDEEKIVELYRKEGYLNAAVETQVKPIPDTGEVTVFFNISEGDEVRISEIVFDGARAIKPGDLEDVMQTTAKSFPFHSGILTASEFDLDQERIILYYREHGYLDARILDVDYDYTPDGRRLKLVIHLEEGEQYHTGQVTVRGNERFSAEELQGRLTMIDGTVFSPMSLRNDYRSLLDFYQSRGYMDADIRPVQSYNPATERMDLTYQISEGDISFIDRIDIEGNEITKDVVIRREMGVRPGDVYDGVRVRRSRERLLNLGYFETVVIDQVPARDPGQKDLVVKVTEKKTGQFMFGFGYSSIDDFIGYAEISQSNVDILNPANGFMGGGQKLRLRGELGTERSLYELSFTEPWLFGIPLSAGFDVYRRDRAWSEYDESRKGFDLRFRRRLFWIVQGGVIYRLEQVDISDIADGAFPELYLEEGKNWISSIVPSLSTDTRDSFLIPTRGTKNVLACELAGGVLGGSKDYVKTTYDFSYYLELWWPTWVLAFKMRAGTASAYGDTDVVPIYERFYLGGGNSIRGFRYREVGPFYQDPDDGDYEPIGGDSMLMGTFELTFPIIEMVRGALFCDIGNVWVDSQWTEEGVGWPATEDFDILSGDWFKTLNSGAGIGLRLYLPIGPIKLDYGWPLRTGPDGWNDTGGRFHFNIGYEW
ncbi:MAG TPA: outer membrane protein assembly factor BamA [bacterium]|nr:outer membrane protein assembly factor BamA [bacterium]